VRQCVSSRRRIEELPLEELKRFSAAIDKDIYDYLSADAMVERRRAIGGTARRNVLRRLKELRV
jgi:argininosuccinate lyase